MRIAFVGIEKDWDILERRSYLDKFVQYHLELPYYYALYGNNVVDIVSDYHSGPMQLGDSSIVQVIRPEDIKKYTDLYGKYDVVVHWRKWIDELYDPNAVNVINSQDHSYNTEWLGKVHRATKEGKLYGILCFPEWHENNLKAELSVLPESPRLLSGVTLGVDTNTYSPSKNKSPYSLLWASDPGRGYYGAVEVSLKLFQLDKRFKLHLCWPDYALGNNVPSHPVIQVHRNLDNGPKLWNLFNEAGFLPYTSTFKEPSSRAHRQAMAAGCVVLYPPNMGTPSDLLTSNIDGIVDDVEYWVETIYSIANDEKRFNRISKNAREHALRENWEVQAQRFNKLFEGILND